MKRSLTKMVGAGLGAGLMIGALGLATGASAAPGDPTMGDGVTWSQGFSLVYDVAVTRNGRVFFGYSDMSTPTSAVIKRYTGDGALTRTITMSEPGVSVGLVDIEAAGNRVYVVLQASSEKGYFIKRLNAAGDVDMAWGGDGEVIAREINEQENAAVVAQAMPDGGVAIATSDRVFVFDADGSMDESFSNDGIARVPMPKNGQTVDMAVASDGSLAFVGTAGLIERSGFVGRLDASGAVMAGFGNNGFVRRDYPNRVDAGISEVEFDSKGRIVLGVQYKTGADKPERLGAGRLRKNGKVDTTFSGDGWASYSLGGESMAGMAIAVQPDDKVVVMGGSGMTWSALRLKENGQRDKSFGGDGIVELEGSERETAYVLRAEIDKRNDQIVMAGATPLEDAAESIGLAGISMS